MTRMIKCPHCAKRGELRLYRDGSGYVIHSTKKNFLGLPVSRGCCLSAADVSHMRSQTRGTP